MEPTAEPKSSKPNSAPSWVMLGFILGGLCVLAVPRPSPPPPEPPAAPPRPPAPPPAPRLTTIEAVFDEWGKYAVWNQNVTEVALWDTDTKAYDECYEVLRVGGSDYFRSISRLTRPVLTHGLPDDPAMPLEFTETDAQRQEWLRETGQENWNALRQALHPDLPPPAPVQP
jgi:hypothetical protein